MHWSAEPQAAAASGWRRAQGRSPRQALSSRCCQTIFTQGLSSQPLTFSLLSMLFSLFEKVKQNKSES